MTGESRKSSKEGHEPTLGDEPAKAVRKKSRAKKTRKGRARSEAAPKAIGKRAGARKTSGGKRSVAETEASTTPVGTTSEQTIAPASGKGAEARPKKRRPARSTYLVAVTVAVAGEADLRVFAVVARTVAEALATVRAKAEPGAVVELTGKLSNRTSKALGLQPDEVRQV